MLKHHTHFHRGSPSPKQKQTTFPELTYPTMWKKNIFKSALGWYMLVPSKVTLNPCFGGPTNFRALETMAPIPPSDDSQSNQQWPPLRPEAWLFRQSFQRMLLEVVGGGGYPNPTQAHRWIGVSQKVVVEKHFFGGLILFPKEKRKYVLDYLK